MDSQPTKIGKTIKSLIFDKCENCGLRIKHEDKKWCARCIERYRRKQKGVKECQIQEIVEPLYAEATLADLEDGLVNKISNRPEWQDVFIYGLPGVGKTYAMAAFIRHYMNEGFECVRINFDDYCCAIRATMSPASRKTERDMAEPLKDVDILFIDDLGLRSKQESDFVYLTFYTILNKRQERLLPTFISTNKDLDRIGDSFDSRIASRLASALQIEITGEDRRMKSRNYILGEV